MEMSRNDARGGGLCPSQPAGTRCGFCGAQWCALCSCVMARASGQDIVTSMQRHKLLSNLSRALMSGSASGSGTGLLHERMLRHHAYRQVGDLGPLPVGCQCYRVRVRHLDRLHSPRPRAVHRDPVLVVPPQPLLAGLRTAPGWFGLPNPCSGIAKIWKRSQRGSVDCLVVSMTRPTPSSAQLVGLSQCLPGSSRRLARSAASAAAVVHRF